MENQKYGKQSAAVILDQYGKLIADHCKNGFDEDAKRKIREISGLKERLEKNENTGFAKRIEYSCAVTPQIRQTGNRLSGNAGTAYASLLA